MSAVMCRAVRVELFISRVGLLEYSSTRIPTDTGCDEDELNVNDKMTTDHRNIP